MSLLDVALRAHSAPIHRKTRPWRKAVPGARDLTKPLHVGHFPPPGAPRRPTHQRAYTEDVKQVWSGRMAQAAGKYGEHARWSPSAATPVEPALRRTPSAPRGSGSRRRACRGSLCSPFQRKPLIALLRSSGDVREESIEPLSQPQTAEAWGPSQRRRAYRRRAGSKSTVAGI